MITSGSHGDLPRRFLNHVDEEGGVGVVLQLLEVSKDFVVGCGAKYSLEMKIYTERCAFGTSLSHLQERREFSEKVGLDVEEKVAVLLPLLSVVQNDLLRLTVFVDCFRHHFVDRAVVVDVLVGGFSMAEDVVVISVVDDQDTARLQHIAEILDGNLLIPR